MCQQEPYVLAALLMFTVTLHQQFFNSLPANIRESHHFSDFLHKAKSFLKTKAQDRLDYS